MTAPVLLAALAVGGFVIATVLAWFPPPRRLDERVTPYVQSSRAALGTFQPRTRQHDAGAATTMTALVARLANRAVDIVGRIVDIDGATAVQRRLRHSGLSSAMTVEQYRRRQAVYATGGLALGVAVPAIAGRALGVVLVCGAAGAFLGATRLRNRTAVLIRRRGETMRASLYTMCHLLAVHMATSSGGLLNAVEAVTGHASGPVTDELRDVLDDVRRGTSPVDAFDRAAEITAEPAAGRLYRMLGAETRGGDPTAALMDLANTMRLARRDELERDGTRRHALMLIPLITVIAPVMVLFVIAAVPSMLFRLTH